MQPFSLEFKLLFITFLCLYKFLLYKSDEAEKCQNTIRTYAPQNASENVYSPKNIEWRIAKDVQFGI